MKISAVALVFATAFAKSKAFVSPAAFGGKARFVSSLAVSQSDLDSAQAMVDDIILSTNANPFFVRLAWHDSGTHDVNVKGDWVCCYNVVLSCGLFYIFSHYLFTLIH